jgi:hypothetical protein
MARGNRGSFGRRINDPEILFPLLGLFVLGMLDWRGRSRCGTSTC